MQDYVTTAKNASANAVTYQEVQPQLCCFLSSLTKTEDPITFNQAIKSDHWITAMNTELDALEANGTWDIVELPLVKLILPRNGFTRQNIIQMALLNGTNLV